MSSELAILAGQEELGPVDDIAHRVRAWFAEAWTHPLWVNYRRNSIEDEGYYIGGDGQWSVDGSLDELKTVKSEGRAHVSLNHIQATVDVLTGFERQNRFDLKAAPQSENDVEDAKVMTWVLKYVQDQTETADKCSNVFEDGIIKGMKALKVGVDWTEDPVNGDIRLRELEPGEDVIWDPFWQERDLSDARYMLEFRHTFIDDVIAEWPEQETAIRAATTDLNPLIQDSKAPLVEGDPADQYGRVGDPRDWSLNDLFYSRTEKKVLVIEAWYRDYESAWIVSDKATGKVWEADSAADARAAQETDPENVKAVEKRRRVIRMAVVLPITMQTLEEGNPYENDDQAYPIVAFVAKRKHRDIYGIVRNLKDPQRVENKRESQLLDLVAKLGNIRAMYEENSLVNPTTLKNMWSSEPIAVKMGHKGPEWFAAPLGDLVKALAVSGDRQKLALREVPGVNTELLGLQGDVSSGIAIARRQAQGQVITTVFFDNYRTFRRRVGLRLARRIQQVYTMERVLRITDELGSEFFVTVNPVARQTAEEVQADPQGRKRVLEDVAHLKYDIVISEAPSTPSMRSTALLALLEILKVVPGLAPAMLDIIIELAEIPDRAKILERVRAMMPPGATGEKPPNVQMGGAGGAPGGVAPSLPPTQGGVALPVPTGPGPRPGGRFSIR